MSELKLDLQPVTGSSRAPETPAPAPEAAETAEPLAPTQLRPATAAARPRRARETKVEAALPPAKPTVAAAEPLVGEGPWRDWERSWETRSYRLPPELVDELTERLWQLRIRDIGVPIAAAITHLLDLDDEEVLTLIERADAAKPRRRVGRPPLG
jgi:hypothetical protein